MRAARGALRRARRRARPRRCRRSPGWRPAPTARARPATPGSICPAPARCPTLGIALALAALARRAGRGCAGRGARRRRRRGRAGSRSSPALQLDLGGVHEAAAARARGRASRPERERRGRRARAGWSSSVTYSGHVPSLVDTQLYEPTIRAGLRAAPRRAAAADRATCAPTRRTCSALVLGAARARPARGRSDEPSSPALVQVAGVALAPLLARHRSRR